jgi:5-methylcytosine-specific restriction protein B
MAPQPIEAVFFFKYTTQVFKACYARIPDTPQHKDYTKNYIQVTADAGPELDAVLGRSGKTKLPIEFVWPTGTQVGEVRPHAGDPPSSRRVQLSWRESGKAPTPWKLGDVTKPEYTIPGDSTKVDRDFAEKQREQLEKSGIEPVLVAVKLKDDGARLHVRAYLERPPVGQENAAVGGLPQQLQSAIRRMSGQCGVYRPVPAGAPPTPRATEIVGRIREALAHDTNVLLVGPPGTGKTVALEDLRETAEYEASTGALMFDPDLWHDAFTTDVAGVKVVSLVFHPSYGYENFVAGLVPETEDGRMRLVAQPGPLIALAHWVGTSERRATLILDEFNRGPAAAIFGDTLALLDREKRQNAAGGQPGAHIARPFAGTSMLVPPEFADVDGVRSVSEELRLPARLQIVAALNSSDRSVAPLDAALRRRFAILRIAPDPGVLAAHLGIALVDTNADFAPSTNDPAGWTPTDVKLLALHLLLKLNPRIAAVLGDDFLLGHALLWPVGEAPDNAVRSALCSAFDERIAATLRLTFVDQDDLLAAVLAAGSPEVPPTGPRVATWRQPPAAVASIATPTLELHSTALMTWPDAAISLLAVITG